MICRERVQRRSAAFVGGAVAVLVAVIPIVGCGASEPVVASSSGVSSAEAQPGGSATTSMGNSDVSSELIVKAQSMVRDRTKSKPTSGEAYRTWRQSVAAVEGFEIDSNEEVIYFIFHGDFTDSLAHNPGGVAPARGQIVTITFDARTGERLDWSVIETPISAAGRLGPPLTLTIT